MPRLFRFAPSPTGYLHLGNARSALWNALLARKFGGRFMLRFDDTDVERTREEFATGILEDLAWLGVKHDLFARQSDRVARYEAAFADLAARGLVYPCYETAEELDRKRKRAQARGLPPVYDRAALNLSAAEKTAFEAEGRKPHWRFKLSGGTVRWVDGVRGECHIETASLSDPVMMRGDGSFLYTFASVVDDVDFSVTDILRGEDHVANTAVQIELFNAFGAQLPLFSHHNLIAAANGEEMSKRTGALSLRSFRARGVDPLAVAIVATLTGTSEPVRPLASLDELVNLLDLPKFSRALTKFDPAEIDQLSAKLLHAKPFPDVAAQLAELGISGEMAAPFWQMIHANLARIEDAAEWWNLITKPQHFTVDDAEFLSAAADHLPQEPFGPESWGQWTKALAEATGRKGKPLFMPLRLALTGRETGPELKALLPLLTRAEVLARLGPAR